MHRGPDGPVWPECRATADDAEASAASPCCAEQSNSSNSSGKCIWSFREIKTRRAKMSWAATGLTVKLTRPPEPTQSAK